MALLAPLMAVTTIMDMKDMLPMTVITIMDMQDEAECRIHRLHQWREECHHHLPKVSTPAMVVIILLDVVMMKPTDTDMAESTSDGPKAASRLAPLHTC
jgi:hypothetical protein